MRLDILYVCNQTRCEHCTLPLCQHTTDIKYAANFVNEDGYLMKEAKDFRIAFGKHVDILWQKEGKVFLYLLPTILVQPPHKHYEDFAKVYISWLNFHIIIY